MLNGVTCLTAGANNPVW